MSAGDAVSVTAKAPRDYHCKCKYCKKVIGELLPPKGSVDAKGKPMSYYSRLERREYYADGEKGDGGHIAKTPLHIARWAVQAYSKRGDWVLDPTIGAGTTAVEAVTQGRSAAGMELQYGGVLRANIEKVLADFPGDVDVNIGNGDARNIADFLGQVPACALVVNNPPYSGDVSMPSPAKEGRGKEFRALETRFDYDKTLPNLAFLREGQEYWDAMGKIYSACIKKLRPGGHFVTGIKDMMRNREPFFLHRDFCDLLASLGLEFVGTAFLRHHPATLFLNTYEQFYGVKPPFYQTISVFQKPKTRKK